MPASPRCVQFQCQIDPAWGIRKMGLKAKLELPRGKSEPRLRSSPSLRPGPARWGETLDTPRPVWLATSSTEWPPLGSPSPPCLCIARICLRVLARRLMEQSCSVSPLSVRTQESKKPSISLYFPNPPESLCWVYIRLSAMM